MFSESFEVSSTFTIILIIIAVLVFVIMAIEKVRAERKAKAIIKFSVSELPLTLTPEKTKLKYNIVVSNDKTNTNVELNDSYSKHPLKIHVLNTFSNGMKNFGGKIKRVFKSKTPLNSLFNATNTAVKSIIGLNPMYQPTSEFYIYTHVKDNFESFLTTEEKNGKNSIFSLFIL